MDRRLHSLVLSDSLRGRIQAAIAGTDESAQEKTIPFPTGEKRKKRPARLRRAVQVGLAACLVLVLGVNVAAQVIPGFEHFIQRAGEDLRQLVQPVNLTSTKDGIRMDVLAAVNDGESAVVYLSLTDETGTRVDENTELFNVDIQGSGTGHLMSHGALMDYDSEAGTAFYRLEGDGTQTISGKKITVTVNSILSGIEMYDELDTGITAAQAMNTTAAFTTNGLGAHGMPTNGFSISYGESPEVAYAMGEALHTGEMALLVPGEEPVAATTPSDIEILAIGVADDYLHLQYRATTEAALYASTEFYLTWAGGPATAWESQLASAQVGLGQEYGEEGGRTVYEAYEVIMELPEGVDPKDVSVAACGTTCQEFIDGNWNVTFVLDERPPLLVAENCNIDLTDWTVERITVSSIGVTAYGTGRQTESTPPLFLLVTLKDGTEVSSISGFGASDSGGNLVQKDGFARPIDINDVAKVTANGQEVPVQLAA